MLDDEVDEKFYLSLEQMGKIVNWKAHQKPFEHVNGDNSIVQTLTARGAGEYHSGMITYSPECTETTNLQSQVREATKKGYAEAIDNTIDAEKIKQVGQLYPNSGNPQAGRVYDADGISPTMDTCSGGNRMPKVLIEGTVIDDTQGFDGTRYYDNISPSLRASRSGLKVVTDTVTNSGRDDEVVIDE